MTRPLYLTGVSNAANDAELTATIARIPMTRPFVIRHDTIINTLSYSPLYAGQQPFKIEPGERVFNE